MRSTPRTECLVCMLRPLLTMSSWCGVAVVKAHCPHAGKTTVVFEKWMLLLNLTSLLTVPMLLNAVLATCHVFRIQEHNFRLSVVIEAAFSLTAVVALVVARVKQREKIDELNGLNKIIETRRDYGFDALLGAKTFKVFSTLSYGGVVSTVAVEGLIAWFFFPSPGNLQNYSEFGFYVLVVNIHVQSMSFLQHVIASWLYRTLFLKCFSRARHVLKRKYGGNGFMQELTQCLPKDAPLETELIRVRLLYTGLIYNYKLMNSFTQPSFLLWCVLMTTELVLDCYVLVLNYQNDVPVNSILGIRSYASISLMTMYLVLAGEISKVGDDITSFLFKYPISKLSPVEASQVEMFLKTLRLQKPVLRASDIFTIGTRLLASISGTVITYVLVALQFHASWSKD